jgi:hypothetical protein
MNALFLGTRVENWTNKKTGENGVSHYVALSTDEHPTMELRTDSKTYRDIQSMNLQKLQPVKLEFAIIKGEYGRYSIVLAGLTKQAQTKLQAAA